MATYLKTAKQSPGNDRVWWTTTDPADDGTDGGYTPGDLSGVRVFSVLSSGGGGGGVADLAALITDLEASSDLHVNSLTEGRGFGSSVNGVPEIYRLSLAGGSSGDLAVTPAYVGPNAPTWVAAGLRFVPRAGERDSWLLGVGDGLDLSASQCLVGFRWTDVSWPPTSPEPDAATGVLGGLYDPSDGELLVAGVGWDTGDNEYNNWYLQGPPASTGASGAFAGTAGGYNPEWPPTSFWTTLYGHATSSTLAAFMGGAVHKDTENVYPTYDHVPSAWSPLLVNDAQLCVLVSGVLEATLTDVLIVTLPATTPS